MDIRIGSLNKFIESYDSIFWFLEKEVVVKSHVGTDHSVITRQRVNLK
jgi:hypothetical protein